MLICTQREVCVLCSGAAIIKHGTQLVLEQWQIEETTRKKTTNVQATERMKEWEREKDLANDAMMRAKTVSVEGEAAVDKFKSCVSATMRKCKDSSGSSSRGSCTALAHAQREKRRNPTNGYSKTQATQNVAMLRSFTFLLLLLLSRMRKDHNTARTHTHTSTYTYLSLWLSLFLHPWSPASQLQRRRFTAVTH